MIKLFNIDFFYIFKVKGCIILSTYRKIPGFKVKAVALLHLPLYLIKTRVNLAFHIHYIKEPICMYVLSFSLLLTVLSDKYLNQQNAGAKYYGSKMRSDQRALFLKNKSIMLRRQEQCQRNLRSRNACLYGN